MIKKVFAIAVLGISISLILMNTSCKSCKKEEKLPQVDTTATSSAPVNSINLPHADTAVIPVLAKVLDEAFDACSKKDYAKLGSLIVYRGPDTKRYGYDVFNAKNNYDKKSLSITAEVFNKWNRDVESRDYARVFALDQPDGRTLPVLEVIFISKKSVDRKFFGFLEIEGSYKIADVTSNL